MNQKPAMQIASIALGLALAALAASLFLELRPTDTPPAETSLKEAAKDFAKEVMTGEKRPDPPEVYWLKMAVIGLGIAGLGMGIVALARGENKTLAWGGILIAVAAMSIQYWVAALVILAVIVVLFLFVGGF